jgi:hypothetical protein
LSAILLLLSLEVLSQCLFLKASKEVWNKLDSLYAVQSSASTMQIRMQLATLKKQDLPTLNYFQRVNNLIDSLAAAGAPLRDNEIVVYLLTGLPEEYDSLVTSITTHVEPMSLSEVYTNLLSFETRLISHQGAPIHTGHPVVNFSSCGGHGGRYGGRGGRNGGHNGGRNSGHVPSSGDRNTDRPRY